MSIILEVLGVVGQFGQCLMPPIKRHFSYVFRYERNIENLRNQFGTLENTKDGVQLRVDAAKNNLEVIIPDVNTWLDEVEKIKTEANRFLEEFSTAQTEYIDGLCPNLKTRYVLGKKAKKITELVLQLQVRGEFGSVSLRAGLVSVNFALAGGTGEVFESRNSIEEDVMVALEDDNADIIGIYGMGGVGKTTMAKRIFERVKEESIFPNVVMAVVSREPDVKKIQSEIAVQLGLKLTEDSSLARASQLAQRLMNEEKILIILDDLWEELKLEELRIPIGSTHRGCKILLTTRDKHVCNRMKALDKNTFVVSPLSDKEALSLFKENSCYSEAVSDIAMQIAKECKGLPLALVTIGSTLKGKPLPNWENALSLWSKDLPHNIKGWMKDVYPVLKYSYTNLESEECKSLFLICCLYPEDFEIPIEDLIRVGMGLQMFEGIENLEEARNRVLVLVGTLKDRSLLIEANEGRAVMMHDVIRDVAIHIASEEEHTHMICHNVKEWIRKSGDEKYVGVSVILEANVELPTGLNYPNLELLQLQWNYQSRQAPDNLFDGMRKLKVIDVWNMEIFSLPSSLQFLTNLHTLQLRGTLNCNVSVIGKLVNLEILSFRDSEIEELPEELGALTSLRLLDLHTCDCLIKIAPGVIQKLVRLEELYLFRFMNWEAERDGEQRKNASLVELKALTNLTTLEIQIPNPRLIPEYMWSSMNLKRYSLFIYYEARGERNKCRGIGKVQKEIQLSIPTISPLEEGMKMMLKSIEALYLRGDGAENVMIEVVPECFQHLKRLNIEECDPMEYLGKTESLQHLKGSPTVGVFPVLEELYLESLGGLKEIWHDQLPEGSFRELRHVYVEDCNNLEKFFSLSIGEALPLLEGLEIRDCKLLKEVFSAECRENEGTSNKIRFSKLRYLALENLPSVTIFCNGIHSIEFPQLIALAIDEIGSACLLNQTISFPRLKILYLKNLSSVEEIWSSENPKELLSELEEMVVESCNNLKSLFPIHMARNLINLKKLKIINCKMMIAIISKEEEEEEEQGEETIMKFPSMKELIIKDCPTMKEFSTKSAPYFFSKISFPRLKILYLENLSSVDEIWSRKNQKELLRELEEMDVESCNNLKSLFPIHMARNLINLKKLKIIDCEIMIEIISKEEEEQGDETIMEFPSMKELIITDCPTMKGFFTKSAAYFFSKVSFPMLKTLDQDNVSSIEKIWSFEIQSGSFRGLEKMVVRSCNNLKSLCHVHVARDLIDLKELEIINCEMMIEIISKEEEEEEQGEETIMEFTTMTRLIIKDCPNMKEFSKVSFARLKTLELKALNSMDKIWCRKIQDSSFKELEVLVVESCGNLRSLLPYSVAKCLVNLKQLEIKNCKLMTEIIEKGKEEDVNGEENFNVSFFPQLESLKLEDLDDLRAFCHMKTFSLGEVCTPKRNYIIKDKGSPIETNVNDTIHHPFNEHVARMNENVGTSNTPLFSKVSFTRLTDLVLVGLNSVEEIWCSEIEDGSFRKLKWLQVTSCNKLRSLCLPSVANSLINLYYLKISDCKMMIEVITQDKEEEKQGEEKLNASLFPQLKRLVLVHLDELKMFCHMKHAVELPSLHGLEIDYCSKMETFSLGAISTPKLKWIRRDKNHIETTNVNNTIKHHFNELTMMNETTENLEQDENVFLPKKKKMLNS